jgi:hypothetical protein
MGEVALVMPLACPSLEVDEFERQPFAYLALAMLFDCSVTAVMHVLWQNQGSSEAQQRLALLALGGIGRTTDLSSFEDVQPAITGNRCGARR